MVKPLIEAIGREHMNRNIYNQELIQHLINSRIVVLARNIAKYQELGVSEQTDMRVFDMLQYIQTNIYEPAKLCPEQLSRTFGISPADLSRYFKQHTGETVQQYIAGYITRLIVHRLQHSGK